MSGRGVTWLWTSAAMLAFAANSLLCRAALLHTSIDAATFTAVRLLSGALVLGALVGFRVKRLRAAQASVGSALALLVYATAFSFAYVKLQTGVGALLLFGAVQLTMLGWATYRGERLGPRGGLGALLAAAGLLGLTLPGATVPDPLAASLMAAAGVAWGIYSLRGRGASDPLGATAGNFLRTLPAVAVAWAVTFEPTRHTSGPGLLLAVVSGGLASGLGYVVWYTALRGLSASQASIVQLSVPVLAAALGIAVLGEPLSFRLMAAGSTILVGIALSSTAPRREARSG